MGVRADVSGWMGRMLFLFVMAIAAAYVIVSITGAYIKGLGTRPPAQPAAVVGATATSPDFNETGTLVFYPNNVAPVPYLFYQTRSGHTASKALTFTEAPPAGFFSWTGARVQVTGHAEHEHVVVTSIAHVSAP
ncbi:TPA: hypothetical protein DIV48_00150 [Candidatus Kaiserbacteria bacterium]|nr:MAG: hypothetical protein UY93_C0002G0195 [Parcubacteria group bacterium GW2011_GWA1_56_13]KKW46753.1 MAG: hypothetical protein UY97_C0003G0027 [Parcubacteria group bacterium GW2011_GWB1_57_6]HCR52044.1 hypothetical protein [Candidatus Kaiserbacteria bacterium]